jgi:cell division protein FtsB
MAEILAFAALVLITAPLLLGVWTVHKRRMAELDLQREQITGRVVPEQLETLRREMAELRQTSTEYSLSLDTTLQQLQQRIAFLEERVQSLENKQVVR